MRYAMAVVLLFSAALLSLSHTSAQNALPGALRSGHPRLMALDADIERLREVVKSDPVARKWHAQLRREAEKLLTAAPVEYVLVGPRLLAQSRRCLDRVYTLGLLYRLDGEQRYAERAKKELFAAAAFKDWNPSHFLDTAEMSHAFGIGYDWLYGYLTPEERTLIRQALVEKGLKASLDERKMWWLRVTHNWNQVCNGGLLVGALAIADEEPQLTAAIVNRSLESIKLPMGSYAPDGGWDEGPGYWHYATSYNVYFLAALETAFGSDFAPLKKLLGMPGFAVTGDFRLHSIGPTRKAFNYADGGERADTAPELFWLARQYHRPVWSWAERNKVGAPDALDLIWFDSRGEGAVKEKMPLDAYLKGIDVVFMRSAWEDPQALFIGFKGGDNQANHSHLDLGTFVLDGLGHRWAVDLGGDNYNLPGYFSKAQRWTYYRLRTEGQNTLVIDGQNQETKARARIVAFRSTPERASAIADLTASYPMTRRVWRGVAMLDRKQILIEDEIEAEQPVEIVWGMHTPAQVTIDGKTAGLRLSGAEMTARILSPADAKFEVAPARPATADENQNQGVNKLSIRLPEKTRETRIVVLIEAGQSRLGAPAIAPLKQWPK